MLGAVVGNFQITARLAEGGMGAVYRAEHPLLGKTAAVKVLLPELSSNRELVNRFFQEARAATAVRHPGIVEIYDFGYLQSGAAYIVMELLDGQSLSSVLVTRVRLSEQEALIYTRSIASALATAHAQGVVHRDLKPDNIFLVRDPDVVGGLRPKILDFGIAKVAEAQRVGGASSKTRTGAVMGTPTYMSPEQCRGVGDIDHRSDLYSVGCILYEMLAGRPPFVSDGVGELLAMHQFMAPQPLTEIGVAVSGAAEGLVLKLLQKRPEDRVQSAGDLARMLGHGSMPMTANPGAPTVAGAIMATPSPIVPKPLPIVPTPVPVLGSAQLPAVSSRTTLSAAAGARVTDTGADVTAVGSTPRRSKRGVVFAGLGGVLAGGAAAMIALLGGGESSAPAAAATPPAPQAVIVTIDAGAAMVATTPPPLDAAPETTRLLDAADVVVTAQSAPPAGPAPASAVAAAFAASVTASSAPRATTTVPGAPGKGAAGITTYQGKKNDVPSTKGTNSSNSTNVDRGD